MRTLSSLIGDITAEDMARLANTWIENIYLGNGSLAFYVDGSGVLDTARSYHAGSDWIDLAEFDPTVLNIVIEIYDKHVPKPTWARPFLGWAELLRLNGVITTPPKPPPLGLPNDVPPGVSIAAPPDGAWQLYGP